MLRLPIFAGTGSAPPASPPALIAHTAVHSAGATTPAINTTGATLLVMGIGSYSGGSIPSATDSKSNTWTALTWRIYAPDTVVAQLFYCLAPTVGSGHTFSSSPGDFQSIAVAAFSVCTTADLDVGATGSGGTVQPGSGTPAHANEVLVTALADAQALTATVDSGFTITDRIPASPGTYEGIALAYLVQTTATAKNPAWTVATLQGAAVMGSWA